MRYITVECPLWVSFDIAFCILLDFRKRSQGEFNAAVSNIKEEAGKASDSGAAMKIALGRHFNLLIEIFTDMVFVVLF